VKVLILYNTNFAVRNSQLSVGKLQLAHNFLNPRRRCYEVIETSVSVLLDVTIGLPWKRQH